MGQLILYVASSLDGFIARQDGSVDWLEDFEQSGADFGFGSLMARLDAVIMGAKTYEQVLTFPVDYPYAALESIVMTRRGELARPEGGAAVRFVQGSLADVVAQARQRHARDLWLVGGGELIAQAIEHDLLDVIDLAIMPRLLGQGVALFPPQAHSLTRALHLSELHHYEGGMVRLVYTRPAPPAPQGRP